MAIFERPTEDLVGEVINDLLNNTALTSAAPGTKTRAIIEACMKRINRAYRTFDENIVMSFLRHAEGPFLDWLGEILSLDRLGPARASASAAQQVVKFYVEGNKVFGDVSGGPDITLPVGTLISSSPIDEGSALSAEYMLPVGVVLDRNSSETWVPVISTSAGPAGNVGKYQLRYHDFNQVPDYQSLLVVNMVSIDNGASPESDASYRYRLSKQVTAAESANDTAIRLAALSVPGVADIVSLPYWRGIGTHDILIKATTPYVSDNLILAVQTAVQSIKAVGNHVAADRPEPIKMSFEIELYSRRHLTRPERDELTRQVKQVLTNYVNTLDIGEQFIVNEAVQRIMETSEEIKNMGSATQPFKKVTISFDDGGAQTLIGTSQDYYPENNERLIVNYDLTQPIIITWPDSPVRGSN